MDEIFKPIPGYEGLYLVSNHGRVFSTKEYKTSRLGNKKGNNRYKERRLDKMPTGYWGILLSKDKVKKKFLVHRLVCMAFHGIPKDIDSLTVNHKDGKKDNNFYKNLEWATPSENQIHAIKTGLQISAHGKNHYCAKLQDKDIVEIRNLRGVLPQPQIAKKFGIGQQAVSDIQRRKTWKHVE
jgi:hypothetical protein